MGKPFELAPLFAPRSVAIIGASEKNPWSGLVLNTLKALDFKGRLHLVNKRGGEVMGQPTVTSCQQIGTPVDAAFLAVPAAALREALEDMLAAGIRHGVVVSSGFAEVSEQGAAEQRRLFDWAARQGLVLMGPNSLGAVNLVDSVALSPLPVSAPVLPNGSVALVSQSGATAGLLGMQAQRQNIALSHVVALGNEAMVDLSDVLTYLLEQPEVRAVAVFAETIRRPEAFLQAARRAFELRKPIVILKVGTSPLTAEVAQAHTGALVGDDRVFGAMCRQYGLVRVSALEQLVVTAAVMAHVGPLPDKGFAVASMSGGACEVMADAGSAAGVRFTRFAPDTLARLKDVISDFGAAHNPIDVTGAAMAKPDIFEGVLKALAADPDVGVLACTLEVPGTPEATRGFTLAALQRMVAGLASAECPTLLIEQTMKDTTAHGRELLRAEGAPFLSPGIDATMRALGSAWDWSAWLRKGRLPALAPVSRPPQQRPRSERETLDYLASQGVPVIPAQVVRSREAAGAAAQALGGAVVLKVLSADIAHKTEVGGVVLDVRGAQAAADAYDRIMASVTAAKPAARIEGVIVSPMRQRGLELLVGIARDPTFGLAIAVGLGGVWVEALNDTALRLLPVTPQDVQEMLGELKAQKLLHGYRGAPAVDVKAVSHVVAAIGNAALALGPDLASLEVNPLHVGQNTVEALDALAIWHETPALHPQETMQ